MFRPAFILVLFFTLFYGFAYTAAVTEIAQIAMPEKANGSLVEVGGKAVGAELIGQNFSDAKYFWGRLSANGYDGANSGGTNYSNGNPALVEAAKARISALHGAGDVPGDLVTASGSGLDPDISVVAANYQVTRVATARKISEIEVRDLLNKYTQTRQFGIFGEPRVNVLQLNLALDGKK